MRKRDFLIFGAIFLYTPILLYVAYEFTQEKNAVCYLNQGVAKMESSKQPAPKP